MKDDRGANPTRDVYFCVDIEASGPVPALYNLVSIGVVAVASGPEGWRADPDGFYVELRPDAPGFDPGAMKVHGLTRKHLDAEGVRADEAMRRLDAFVRARGAAAGGHAVFVGHNAAFDWSFIAYYFERYGIPNPFGYKALDTKSLAMGRLRIGWFETGKENLEVLLRLPPQDEGLIHRADYDARYQAGILCALLNRGGPPEA